MITAFGSKHKMKKFWQKNHDTSIEFNNVTFSYPTRDQEVLKNFSMIIKQGQTAALCGNSGSGKSTTIQLLQRFYNYSGGSIKIGGKKIEDFNVSELRKQIGVVNQEPVLFDTTIRENIKMGNSEATEEQIIDAIRQANAYAKDLLIIIFQV